MSDLISRQDGKIKVAKGQDPYNVIGNYIREHLTVIEDMIAVIRINDSITNELFLVDWHEDSCFVWHHDWWEGEENVELIDFFPVSDSERLPDPEPCEDAVPRTSVEYICRKNTVSTNPYEHKYHDKFIQFMDDPEISDFGRWQYSNGFNTALVAVKCDLDKVPSAQPERMKGKWILHYDEMMLPDGMSISGVECSKCGWKTYNKIYRLIACPYNFCPNCGADMREGQDD